MNYMKYMNLAAFDTSRKFKERTLLSVLVLAQERFSAKTIGQFLLLGESTVNYIIRTYGRSLTLRGQRNNLSRLRDTLSLRNVNGRRKQASAKAQRARRRDPNFRIAAAS